MAVTGIFDAMFVNQLFHTNERGELIYYPNGRKAQGYLVPPERERGVRSSLRWLVLISQIGVIALVVVVPRMMESWLGYTLPLSWFIGGALVLVVVIGAAILRSLSRIAVGLEPLSARG